MQVNIRHTVMFPCRAKIYDEMLSIQSATQLIGGALTNRIALNIFCLNILMTVNCITHIGSKYIYIYQQ